MHSLDGLTRSRTKEPQPPHVRRRKRKFFVLLVFLFIIAALGLSSSKILSKTNKIFTNKENTFVRIGKFLVSNEKKLQGEDSGKVNILLLGMGGEGHEGPLLTDTMIVAQIDVETSEVILISIPRDFLVQLPKRGFSKINAAYAWAESATPGAGGEAAMQAAEKVTGFEIPYFASIDFKGFTKAVDHVGGLEIEVEKTFTDSQYPDNRNWYLPPVTFKKGMEHMDGTRALQFARSRKGNNGEGSDFARSARQKKILSAFKDKVKTLNITDAKTINNLLADFTDHFRTNLEPHELKRLGTLGEKISEENIYSLSLEPDGSLICDALIEDYTNRAYVIQPCEGKTLSDVHDYLKDAVLISKLSKEGATIEIQNSTGKSYVTQPFKGLSKYGLDVSFVTFKGKTPYVRTILYENRKGQKPKTLDYLKSLYQMDMADVPFSSSTADFVIVIGKNLL